MPEKLPPNIDNEDISLHKYLEHNEVSSLLGTTITSSIHNHGRPMVVIGVSEDSMAVDAIDVKSDGTYGMFPGTVRIEDVDIIIDYKDRDKSFDNYLKSLDISDNKL